MRPKPRILEFPNRQIAESKHCVAASAEIIQFSAERMAAAQKAISTSQAREQRHRERLEKKAA